MWFRAVKPFTYQGQIGEDVDVEPGQIVPLINRHVAAHHLRMGNVVDAEYSHVSSDTLAEASSDPGHVTLRVGIWMKTTPWYSGGRVFMYQYGLALATLGAEVWLVTNLRPRWADDWPSCNRFHLCIQDAEPVPPDLDLVVSDNKGEQATKALEFRDKHSPNAKYVLFNFETPNWVTELGLPEVAQRMSHESFRQEQNQADMHVSCSLEGQKRLWKWIEPRHTVKLCTLYPTFNVDAAARATDRALIDRRYAVFCSRSEEYKGYELAWRAVQACDGQLDLAVIGNTPLNTLGEGDHLLHHFADCDDTLKYRLLRHAHFALCPSRFEGFGLVPGEALIAGTRSVVFDLPVYREAYGDNLVYVEQGNDDEYIRAVRRLGAEDKPNIEDARTWCEKTYGFETFKERVDNLPYHHFTKPFVSVQMIAYWGKSAPHAIASVYDDVDEIIVAYGPIEATQHVPEDGTWELLNAIDDPGDKIKLMRLPEGKAWPDKQAMREACSAKAEGNFMLVLDADEIWDNFAEWLELRCPIGSPRWVHFWHDLRHYVTTGRWGDVLPNGDFGTVCAHYRWSWWRPSNKWRNHNWPHTWNNKALSYMEVNRQTAAESPAVIYHLGAAMPKQLMKVKHDFYCQRDGRDKLRVNAHNSWWYWAGQPGECGDGVVKQVTWQLPELVERGFAALHDKVSNDALLEYQAN